MRQFFKKHQQHPADMGVDGWGCMTLPRIYRLITPCTIVGGNCLSKSRSNCLFTQKSLSHHVRVYDDDDHATRNGIACFADARAAVDNQRVGRRHVITGEIARRGGFFYSLPDFMLKEARKPDACSHMYIISSSTQITKKDRSATEVGIRRYRVGRQDFRSL